MATTYLIDTYILVYAYNKDSELHTKSLSILQDALDGKITAYLADKNLYEFYAIITDIKRVEKPVTTEDAIKVIELLMNSKIEILYTTFKTLTILTEILRKFKIIEQKIFDYVLVALVIENNINTILTRNEKDFENIKEINVLNPFEKR